MVKRIKIVVWSLYQLASAGCGEFWALLGLAVLLGFLPALSLFALSSAVNWLVAPVSLARPMIFLAAWVAIFALEKGTVPILAILRVRLNEKALVHFNTKFIRCINKIDGLAPFETREVQDEMHFLEVESARRPMNLVYILSDLVREVVTIAMLSVLLSVVSWGLGIVVLLASAPHALAVMWMERLRWTETLFNSPHSRSLRWLTSVAASGEKAKEVRLFGFGEFLAARYSTLAHGFIKSFSKKCWGQTVPALVCTGLTIVGYAGIVMWVVQSAISKGVRAGDFVVVLQGFNLMHMQMAAILQSLAMLVPALDYFSRFSRFTQRADLCLPMSVWPQRVRTVSRHIRFEDVSFCYPDGREALRDINLQLSVGQKVALVGENGAGKTTLVKLLLRFYDPTKGRILVDGVDLKELDLVEWRRLFSGVFQDFGRYHFSLRENIELAKGGKRLSVDQLEWALSRSSAIGLPDSLPKGMDTVLGSELGGAALSGGQWQKVAMARAFARDAELLVFDEPTAALDPKSEAEVFTQFAQASLGKTAILVTHRLGSVSMADQVVMLGNGSIIESGSHPELLAKKGMYAQFFNLQADQFKR